MHDIEEREQSYELDVDTIEQREHIRRALEARLAKREQEIMRMLFYHGLTRAEIGREIGVTTSRVGQLVDKSIKRMRYYFIRNNIGGEMLFKYLRRRYGVKAEMKARRKQSKRLFIAS